MSTTDPGGAGSRVLRISGIKRPLQKRTQTDDWVRALLAVLLFGLLAAEIGCAMYVIITCSAPMHDKAIEHFKDVLTMALSPTIALFGAATGSIMVQRAMEEAVKTANVVGFEDRPAPISKSRLVAGMACASDNTVIDPAGLGLRRGGMRVPA